MLTTLLEKRKESLAKMDELDRSIFFELFGHPNKNEKNFPKGRMEKLILEIKHEKNAKTPRENGDILFDKKNQQFIVFQETEDMNISKDIIRIRVNHLVNPYYVSHCLKMIVEHTCETIHLTGIKNISILIPPKELQNEYAERYLHICNQKKNMNIQLEHMKQLKDCFQKKIQP